MSELPCLHLIRSRCVGADVPELCDEIEVLRARITELEDELDQLRDEMADYDHNLLAKFDKRAADSTDLYTFIKCKLREIERLKMS